MTDNTNLHGSKCSTLTDDQRVQIEQADDRSKARLTLCGQLSLDCDDYLAHATGTLHKRVYTSFAPDGAEVRLDWCDHGHTIHYFVDGWHVASRPTAQVLPRDYLESIWSAGRVIAHRLVRE